MMNLVEHPGFVGDGEVEGCAQHQQYEGTRHGRETYLKRPQQNYRLTMQELHSSNGYMRSADLNSCSYE